jgi:hypothetical protein
VRIARERRAQGAVDVPPPLAAAVAAAAEQPSSPYRELDADADGLERISCETISDDGEGNIGKSPPLRFDPARDRAESMPILSLHAARRRQQPRHGSHLGAPALRPRLTQRSDSPGGDRSSTTSSPLGFQFLGIKENVLRTPLPPVEDLRDYLGADVSYGELLIGEVQRLNAWTMAKFKMAEDVKDMLRDTAYAGPAVNSQLFDTIVSKALDHYSLYKGKNSRRVYVRGNVLRMDLEVGVAKVPRRPLHAGEEGAEYVLYSRQM